MKELIQKLDEYCEHTNKESKRIHDVLVELIQKVGGEIDTSNENTYNDTLYAYVWNDFAESCTEFRIDKVRVKNNYVEVHAPDFYSEDENDLWFPVMGGLVLINATLYNLCECLPEYIKEIDD